MTKHDNGKNLNEVGIDSVLDCGHINAGEAFVGTNTISTSRTTAINTSQTLSGSIIFMNAVIFVLAFPPIQLILPTAQDIVDSIPGGGRESNSYRFAISNFGFNDVTILGNIPGGTTASGTAFVVPPGTGGDYLVYVSSLKPTPTVTIFATGLF